MQIKEPLEYIAMMLALLMIGFAYYLGMQTQSAVAVTDSQACYQMCVDIGQEKAPERDYRTECLACFNQ